MASVNKRKPQHITQETTVSLRILAVHDNVCAKNHGFFLSGAIISTGLRLSHTNRARIIQLTYGRWYAKLSIDAIYLRSSGLLHAPRLLLRVLFVLLWL
jgi:hypothetical protein